MKIISKIYNISSYKPYKIVCFEWVTKRKLHRLGLIFSKFDKLWNIEYFENKENKEKKGKHWRLLWFAYGYTNT